MNDTNRITYVKERFFHNFKPFDRVELSERQTKKERRKNYEKEREKSLLIGSLFLAMFTVWTVLIQTVDVQPLGQNGTSIGFAAFNCWFHHFTGVNMAIYTITDWMGLVPVVICLIFAGIGLVQLMKRRSLFRVDADIMILERILSRIILPLSQFHVIPISI